MTKTAWADLPNAKYIDLILADLKANPDKWVAVRAEDCAEARGAAWGAVWREDRALVWNAAWDAVGGADRTTAWCAILCLIGYDDCAYLLDEKPEYVQPLAASGQTQAILLYPACLALQKEKA